MSFTIMQKIAIWAIPLIFAITLHEVAHGWVANFFGDKTAKFSGRLSLNPLRHVDWIGTVFLPLFMLAVSNFIFGWAKPVPVDNRNFKNPRRDMAFVAVAGPIANLVMALLWAYLARFGSFLEIKNPWFGVPLTYMGGAGIMINVVLGILNLIPIPPLDGGRLLLCILPPRLAWHVSKFEPYGFAVLLLLLITGALSVILTPFVAITLHSIMFLAGLS